MKLKLELKHLFFTLFLYSTTYSQVDSNELIENAGFIKEIIYCKNDTITYLHNKLTDKNSKKPLIVFVQGSKGFPLLFTHERGIGCIMPFNYKDYLVKYNFVIISRKGIPLVGQYDKDGYVDDRGNIPLGFKKHDNLDYRSFQLEQVLKVLNKKKWVDKKKIFIIGHSEGYRVVAKVAEKNKYASKLVFMSADPFNRVAEYVVRNRLECFFSDKDSIYQSEIDQSLKDATEMKSEKNVASDDYDLKNWLSYNSSVTYNSLKKVQKPSLIVYGTDDVVSFNNDVLNFLLDRKTFKILALPNLDHNYFKQEFDEHGKPKEKSFHWDDVFKMVVHWLEEN